MYQARITRTYDIRPLDFQTGKRLAIAAVNQETCACCGKRIVKVNELTNGDKLGSECANWVEYFRNVKTENVKALAAFGISEKQASYFRQLQ